MSVFPAKHPPPVSDDDRHVPYRAVPLSTKNIICIVAFLALFSFVYLFYAQHHKVLFYFMTGGIVVWIGFVYSAGILAVLYMVQADYKSDERAGERRLREKESSI